MPHPQRRPSESMPNPGIAPIEPASRLIRNGFATKTRYNNPHAKQAPTPR